MTIQAPAIKHQQQRLGSGSARAASFYRIGSMARRVLPGRGCVVERQAGPG